ncbi:MAG: hypothetical protein ACR2QM_04260 [Longimicrobiales bacterium]
MTADLLQTLPKSAPRELDLTSRDHLDAVRSMADELEGVATSSAQLQMLETQISTDDAVPVSFRVAVKLATSRFLLGELKAPVHVSLVLAVYKENLRILTAQEHPAGEDFLREKLRQLRWLFEPTPRHTWDLTVVDDGCPQGSGRLAQAVLKEFARPEEEVQVLFLEDAIREGLSIVGNLDSTGGSQKGGAVRLGLWNAVQKHRGPNHVVAFTDADLSTHVGQLGLLASPLAEAGVCCAVGSRREPSSVVVKAGARNARGKLFIYLWKRLIPQLRGIVDTQCGFKAFDAVHLSSWIEDVQDNGFSFDVELLLRLQLLRPGSIRKVPIAWIDSEAASTTTELEPYLPMLKSVTRLYRGELPSSPLSEPFAGLIERLDEGSFRELAANVPAQIADRDPSGFDDFVGVSADDLAGAAGL